MPAQENMRKLNSKKRRVMKEKAVIEKNWQCIDFDEERD